MVETLLSYEPIIRLIAFAGVFAAMAAWEILAPRRDQGIGRSTRWPSNIGIVVLDTVLVRVLFPTTAVALALLAEAKGWGLFHALDLPLWASIPQIFYLFSVRYVHGTSLTFQGLLGTPAVLMGVSGIIVLQLAFTYAHFMNRWFGTAPVAIGDGVVIIGVGIALLLILEFEKLVRRWRVALQTRGP
jgi:hypothetical protein